MCARAPGIRSWRLLFTPGCVRNGAGLMAPVVVCTSRAHRKGMSRAVVSEAQTGLGPYMVVRLVPVVVVLCLVNCSRMVKTLRGLIFKTTANNRMFFFLTRLGVGAHRGLLPGEHQHSLMTSPAVGSWICGRSEKWGIFSLWKKCSHRRAEI